MGLAVAANPDILGSVLSELDISYRSCILIGAVGKHILSKAAFSVFDESLARRLSYRRPATR
jgi:hypothetical protein